MPETTTAREGEVWVCGACGKRARDRVSGGIDHGWDCSCYMHAVLCVESSVVCASDGRVCRATAVGHLESVTMQVRS